MKSKSRSWRPLAYPRAALVDSNKEENALFPLHRTMLTVILRELLASDGTLDPESLTVTEELVPHKHEGTQEMKLMTRVQGHLTPGWRACSVGTADRGKEEKNNRRRGRKSKQEAPRKRPCLGRRENLCESKVEAKTEKPKPCVYDLSTVSCAEQAPCTVECSSGEELAATLLGRCIQGRNPPTSDGQLGYSFFDYTIAKQAGGSIDEGSRPQRARKVSDLDMIDDGKNHQAAISDASMATAKDICRFSLLFSKESTANLDKVHFHLTLHDLPPLLEASIATESRLRSLALSLCRDVFSSFSDECLRSFFGYKSSCISRENLLLPMLADYVFITSHALFAWEATQQEKSIAEGRSPEEQNLYIRETLFDARTLESLGGWEWSSLFRQAVHLLSLGETAMSESNRGCMSWETWARTKQGHRSLAHLKSAETMLKVARRRRQGKRQAIHPTSHAIVAPVEEEPTENLLQATRSRSSSIASQGSALQPAVEETKKVNTLPSTTTVRLERTPGQSWGVLLSREGDMCLVARGSSDPNKDLRSGDIILHAENERATTAHVSYRQIVDLFKTSHQLVLQVQRVSC